MSETAPKIIYKQQHVDNNGRKYSSSRNAHYALYIGMREHVLKKSADERSSDKYNVTHEHITNLVKYIGEREHAAKKIIEKRVRVTKDELITFDKEVSDEQPSEEEQEYYEEEFDENDNGLFGYIGGMFSDEYNMRDVQQYVRLMSEEHNIFHSIFSFTPESADKAGLHSLEDWENWVKYHIGEIAQGMNMKTEDIEYVAAVHLKEGQPHVHIEWWNKQQKIFINMVNPLVCDAIRISAIKSTYRGQFNELHNTEDAFVKAIRDNITEQTENILTKSARDEYANVIGKALNHIGDILPEKGQLKYGFMPYDVKEEIDKLTHYIIDNNPQLSRLYDSALEQRKLYNEMLHSTESSYGKYKLAKFTGKLNDDIERNIGNAVLRIIKREKKEGRQKLIEALDAVPIEDFGGERWMKYSERESFETGVQWSGRFKQAREFAKEKRYSDALELYKQEAEAGNALAEYEIADLYRRGLIDGRDDSREHYTKALIGFLEAEKTAKKLKPYLQYRIGRMYYDGYGTREDFAEALKWLEKSAEGGNRLAAKTAAEMYRGGKGTVPNPGRAAELYEKNSDKDAWSAFALAKMYIKGDIPKDIGKAISLLNKSKSLDSELAPLADYTLGTIYLFNDEFHDRELAEKYLTLSAQAGNEYAQRLLNNNAMWQQRNVASLLNDVLRILSSCEQDGKSALSEASATVFGRGDLSREQLRELLLKLQDKENTAEM